MIRRRIHCAAGIVSVGRGHFVANGLALGSADDECLIVGVTVAVVLAER